MKHRLLALAAAGALCLSLCGFSGTQPLPDTITVQGTGIVEARPDQTKFTAGVNVVKPTAAEAVSAGNEMAAGVRQALMDAGVPEENIITDGLWLWEHYTYTNYTSYRDGYEYRVSFTVKVPEGLSDLRKIRHRQNRTGRDRHRRPDAHGLRQAVRPAQPLRKGTEPADRRNVFRR